LVDVESKKESKIPSESSIRLEKLAKEKKELEEKLKLGEIALAESTKISLNDGSESSSRIKKLTEQKRKLLEEEAKYKSIGSLNSEKLVELEEFQRVQFGVDLCFIMDCTGSMSEWMKIAAAKIGDIMNAAKHINPKARLRCGFVGYRDIEDKHLRFDIIDFKESDQIPALQTKLNSLVATGGGDEPEDIAGGFFQALKLSWKSSTKLVIHIADAPCHGKQYHDSMDNHSNGDPEGRIPEDLLRKMCNQSIDFYFCRINNRTNKMTSIFQRVYIDSNKPFVIVDIGSDTSKFLPTVVASISASMSRSSMFM